MSPSERLAEAIQRAGQYGKEVEYKQDNEQFTRDNLMKLHTKLTTKAKKIMKQKNDDYTNKDLENPFSNFKACEEFGVCGTGTGFLVRMLDKFKRILTFKENGKLSVDNEGLEDAIIDLINYLILFYGWVKSKE